MNERDDVEAVIDRVAVSELLIAAVTLVLRGAQNGNLEGRVSLLIAQSVDERVVLRRIVDDQDLDLLALQRARNAAEDFFYRRRRILGNDENKQPLAG